MNDPHWWLRIIRRVEKIVGLAFVVTALWLWLWIMLWPEEYGRVLAIAYMSMLIFCSVSLGLVSWIWKAYLLEMIDEVESYRNWKELNESRWPSG